MNQLLARDEFREAVFKRDRRCCVWCGQPGQDAHHIIERRLFPDQGYYLDNGATLCANCHMAAERTDITCEALWKKIGIDPKQAPLPPSFDPADAYDKWGNVVLPNGMRMQGPLFHDAAVQTLLADKMPLFIKRFKYPRTLHLPWSQGMTSDDVRLVSVEQFIGKRVIVTEKMDGENTTMYADGIHARSLDTLSHPSRTWVKRLQARLSVDIPPGYRVCGENLFATHSIFYTNLPSYFLVFSIWNEFNECLSWDDTQEFCQLLDLPTVPVLYDGPWDEQIIRGLYQPERDGHEMEGYVVRNAASFSYRQITQNLAKFVRAHHVKTDQHWLQQELVQNQLAEPWWP